jgi:hypothetical protein
MPNEADKTEPTTSADDSAPVAALTIDCNDTEGFCAEYRNATPAQKEALRQAWSNQCGDLPECVEEPALE